MPASSAKLPPVTYIIDIAIVTLVPYKRWYVALTASEISYIVSRQNTLTDLKQKTHSDDRKRNSEIMTSCQSKPPGRIFVSMEFDFFAHGRLLNKRREQKTCFKIVQLNHVKINSIKRFAQLQVHRIE